MSALEWAGITLAVALAAFYGRWHWTLRSWAYSLDHRETALDEWEGELHQLNSDLMSECAKVEAMESKAMKHLENARRVLKVLTERLEGAEL